MKRKNLQLQLHILNLIIVFALIVLNSGCAFTSQSSLPTTPTPVSSKIPLSPTPVGGSSKFVSRSGSHLLLDGQPFRFSGANIYWLGLDDSSNYPSPFRVNDGLDAAKEMGATVVRSHTLGISTGCRNCVEPALGVFNQTALIHRDYAIKAARDRGIRLIIPLTDNWHYAMGGKHNFTEWRGISDENQFYFNQLVINDFETYIKTLLNHVNIYTGIAYKDDPTIMAWETGNEIEPPINWTQTIATYIKSIDGNHLVIDGRTGVYPGSTNITNVDIISNHYYPKNIALLKSDIDAAKKEDKVFYVGEFEWNDIDGGDSLSGFLSAIESNPIVAGDTFWDLWSHNDVYGYISGDKYTLHYPGDSPVMKASVQMLRMHAYNMKGLSIPIDGVPGIPSISVVIKGNPSNTIIWQGTALAASYTIERSIEGANGPWTVICDRCVTDITVPWIDKIPPLGTLWYRAIAYNLVGIAGEPSKAYQVGATKAGIMQDNLNDWSKSYQHSNNLIFNTTNAQYFGNDTSTINRTQLTREWIIWKQAGMTSFQAITYFWPEESIVDFSLYTSTDGNNWVLSHPKISNLRGNWLKYVYTLSSLTNVTFIKMQWNNISGELWSPVISKITITH